KQGGALTLTVITSNDATCVDLSGAFTAHQTSPGAKTTWTFSLAAPAGDGAQVVTATAGPSSNATKCTGATGAGNGTYTLDNTGPTVTAVLSPAANAAGWNNSNNVTITWSATEPGGS